MIGLLEKTAAFAALPPVWSDDPLPAIRHALGAVSRKLVVLDDDPTGTQTVYDVPVVTRWDEATLAAELANDLPCFYCLTNSRSLDAADARTLNLELAANLRRAAARRERTFTIVSRSDSTLRGHFAEETEALTEITGPYDATIVFPYFEAGGRFTLHDVHYVAEGDRLVPAASTPFAATPRSATPTPISDDGSRKSSGRSGPTPSHPSRGPSPPSDRSRCGLRTAA